MSVVITKRTPLHDRGLCELVKLSIHGLRKDRRTYREIAEHLGVSKTTVLNFESGKQLIVGPKLEVRLAQICAGGSLVVLRATALARLHDAHGVDAGELSVEQDAAWEAYYDEDPSRREPVNALIHESLTKIETGAGENDPKASALLAAIRYHDHKWEPAVVTAAYASDVGRDVTPREWADLMDRIQSAIKDARDALRAAEPALGSQATQAPEASAQPKATRRKGKPR